MNILFNLAKIKRVNLMGVDVFTPKVAKLLVYYYDDEPCFEHVVRLTDLCDSIAKFQEEKVRKAYNDIKQALLKDEKYVEVEL